ncbi:MAG: COX15/CtaA family protein [Pseudomonadota bacterium]
MKRTTFATFAGLAALLTFIVVTFGAYVRLSNAGLGCPDWPGCYGRLVVPAAQEAVAAANQSYPQRPLEMTKAWKEMIHRYLASGLGLVILLLAVAAWRNHRRSDLPVGLPTVLVALVIFQGLLGMWTVTWLVKPVIVTAHLAGGMATLALLGWLALRSSGCFIAPVHTLLAGLKPWVVIGLLLLSLQILLGGWTSSNYAAMGCSEFPTCYWNQWWPPTDFSEAFTLWRGLGVNYEGGVLDSAARTAIHLVHRLGALILFVYLGILAVLVWRRANYPTHGRLGLALGAVLLVQLGLGIGSVLGHLPIEVAVAHNGGAALLLLTLVALLHALTASDSLSHEKFA